MRVETVQGNGSASWVVGLVGASSERFRKVTLSADDLQLLRFCLNLRPNDSDDAVRESDHAISHARADKRADEPNPQCRHEAGTCGAQDRPRHGLSISSAST